MRPPLEGVRNRTFGILGRQGATATMPSRCNSRLELGSQDEGPPRNVRSIRATSCARGVPWRTSTPQRRGISRTTSSISPEQGDPNVRRLLAVHSLPSRGMNRRLIVQFDPDEPSMSAASPSRKPDQVRQRRPEGRNGQGDDSTLGLGGRDCEILARVSEMVIVLRRSPKCGCGRSHAIADRVKFRCKRSLDPDPLARRPTVGAQEGFPRHRDQ